MCVNLETSLLSFIIGAGSGFLLTAQTIERKLIGLFVIFYSLIQLFEACVYWTNDKEKNNFYSKLLMLNLGFQGLIFFFLMNQIYFIDSFYLIICLGIALFSIYSSFDTNDDSVQLDNCIKWNFLTKDVSLMLGLMYGLILIWFWFDDKKINNSVNKSIDTEFILKTGYLLTGTWLFSFFLTKNCNNAGIWCLTSAIVTPVLLLL